MTVSLVCLLAALLVIVLSIRWANWLLAVADAPADEVAPEARCLDVLRPSYWLPAILLALGTLSGCVFPARPICCQTSCSNLNPHWIEPARQYGEPMHPILREDGQTVLMPHTQFRGWIRDDSPPSSGFKPPD